LLHVTSSSHIDLVRTSFTTQVPSSRRVESHSLFIIRNLSVKSSHHQFPPTALIFPQLQFATASVFNPLFLHLNFLRILPLKFSLHSSKLAPLSYFYCSSISRLQSHTATNFSFGISLPLLSNTDLDLVYLQVRSRSIFLHIPLHPRASVISGRQSERPSHLPSPHPFLKLNGICLHLLNSRTLLSFHFFNAFKSRINHSTKYTRSRHLAIHSNSLTFSFDNTSLFAESFPTKVLLHYQGG
jgi:hypothetical protein